MHNPSTRCVRRYGLCATIVAAGLVLAGCAPEPAPQPGAQAYQDYCAICHGQSAMGDGELARALAVPPPDLTRISARNGGVFPLRAVADSVYGYAGKHDRDLMPEFTALLDGPQTVLTDAEGRPQQVPQRLAEMLMYLQSLQR